jgi:hypothetical protein
MGLNVLGALERSIPNAAAVAIASDCLVRKEQIVGHFRTTEVRVIVIMTVVLHHGIERRDEIESSGFLLFEGASKEWLIVGYEEVVRERSGAGAVGLVAAALSAVAALGLCVRLPVNDG